LSIRVRLYHVPDTGSRAALWLLEEVGEPYEITYLVRDRQARAADPERRHPFGRVPALEDDGFVLFEGLAIQLYVGDKYPQTGLLPPLGTTARGLTYQWAAFAFTELTSKLLQTRLVASVSSPEAEETARAVMLQQHGSLQEPLDAVAAALEGNDFLVGGAFTIADLLVVGMLGHVRRRPDYFPGVGELSPQIVRYIDAIESRPAKQRADARNSAPDAVH
jgi:glutathione S-transferase